MSGKGGDWRSGPAYDYVDQIGVEKIAHEFLRRNDEYAADYAMLSSDPPDEQAAPALARWGCDFAVDPYLRADRTITVWLPQVDPRLALLTRLPTALFADPELAAADPTLIRSAAEGEYLGLLALAPFQGALLLPGQPEGAVAFVLPFDDLIEERIETARRLHRLLVRRRTPPASLTAYRRRRLKLALRALDGSLAGADYRAIAEALFGERVPRGADFRDASLRAQAIRLVRYGVSLMRGGYLDLLRPGRRAR